MIFTCVEILCSVSRHLPYIGNWIDMFLTLVTFPASSSYWMSITYTMQWLSNKWKSLDFPSPFLFYSLSSASIPPCERHILVVVVNHKSTDILASSCFFAPLHVYQNNCESRNTPGHVHYHVLLILLPMHLSSRASHFPYFPLFLLGGATVTSLFLTIS